MEISITWNICRVCLAEEEKKPPRDAEPMHHLFDEDEMLVKQIYECSGIAMKPDDKLPEKICKTCYTLIKYAVSFRETCRASDAYLQNILQRTKSASALLKNPQSSSLDDIVIHDCSTVDNNDGQPNEPSEKSKHKMEKSSKKFKDSDYSDLIEFENEFENDLKDNVADDILEYNGSYVNEEIDTAGHNDESNESQIVLQLSSSPHKENHHFNEEIVENQEFETENFKQNNDDHNVGNCEKEDDDNVESFELLDEFIVHKGRHSRGMTFEMESESSDSQAKVSSTIALRENDIEIKLEADDSKLSSENTDMQAEYIIDEYVVDENSRNSITSLQNSHVVFVQSKNARPVVKKYQSHMHHSKSAGSVATHVWVCDMCGNNFSNRHLLNGHMKVHRQEKNHECEICLKRFITACNLQAHMRIHTGEKPYECKYCGRRFSDRSSNLRHERTHTDERPFGCKICGKAFSLATTLKKHLKVHSGERSFGCDICDKSFKLPHQLKAHKNSTLHKSVEQLTMLDR